MLSPHGKFVIRDNKVSTTVPITFNGQVINPSGRIRTGDEQLSFKLFKTAAKLWNKTQVKPPRKGNRNTPEARQKDKEKRQATASESKNLIWWISYQALNIDEHRVARFDGDRSFAFKETMRVFKIAVEYVKHCNTNKITDYTILEDITPPEDVSSSSELSSPSSSNGDDVDLFARDTTSEGESGLVAFGPADEPTLIDVYDKQCTDAFHAWWKDIGEDLYGIDSMDDHKCGMIHWNVTCLERPQDMNCFFKYKVPVQSGVVKQLLTFLQIGKDQEERRYMFPEVSCMQHAFSTSRYLAFGYCADGHKCYGDVDPMPHFGYGYIDMPKIYTNTWLAHAIELQKVTELHQLLPKDRDENGLAITYKTSDSGDEQLNRTWLTAIDLRTDVTNRKFNDIYNVLTHIDKSEMTFSNHEIRQQKLFQHANAPQDVESIDNIYRILAHHLMDPELFIAHLNYFLIRDPAQQNCNRVLSFIGKSKSGKSTFLTAIKSLLHVVEWETNNKTAFKCQRYNDSTIDTICIEEFRDTVQSNNINMAEIGTIWDNTDTLNSDKYCDNCPALLPIVVCSQSCYYHLPSGGNNKSDMISLETLKTRMAKVTFRGGPLPQLFSKGGYKISPIAFSQFLAGKTQLPDWYFGYMDEMEKIDNQRTKQLANKYFAGASNVNLQCPKFAQMCENAMFDEQHVQRTTHLMRSKFPHLFVTVQGGLENKCLDRVASVQSMREKYAKRQRGNDDSAIDASLLFPKRQKTENEEDFGAGIGSDGESEDEEQTSMLARLNQEAKDGESSDPEDQHYLHSHPRSSASKKRGLGGAAVFA